MRQYQIKKVSRWKDIKQEEAEFMLYGKYGERYKEAIKELEKYKRVVNFGEWKIRLKPEK